MFADLDQVQIRWMVRDVSFCCPSAPIQTLSVAEQMASGKHLNLLEVGEVMYKRMTSTDHSTLDFSAS